MVTTPLRRNTRFQLLWVGSAVSGLGSSMTYLAFPLLILAVTGSPGLAGIVGACRMAASIAVSMPAGVWVDRFDRRRVLVACEAVRIAATGSLVTVMLVGGADALSLAHILVVAVLSGTADAFFQPAYATAIRAVVPREQLPQAYAQEEARSHAASLAGPPLGGALFGLARVLPFLADLVSYVVSLVCILAARVPRRPAQEVRQEVRQTAGQTAGGRLAEEGRRVRRDVGEAVRWIWRRPGIRAALIFSMVINLVAGAELIPLITMMESRGATSVDSGLVLGAAGVGGLLGAFVAPRLSRTLSPGLLMAAVGGVFGAAMCASTLPFGVYWPAVTLFLGMVTVPALNVVLKVLVARTVPEVMMGRVVAALSMVSLGLEPLSPLIGGALAEVAGGASALLVLGGVLVVASVGFVVLSPALRGLRVEAEAGDEAVSAEGATEPGEAARQGG
ncbi:MFS transporter [Xylanimonas oleitrophica]|uniref:MFS transporter n=1 Tax=Xylanimonas oleitrophica TaxID=2607479 RepID=A0A2W5WRE8_9MICO|nr:MFS transporter [Xylanimonas oleitrophica]PZR53462.1 MFS transporter [Xylanimonas oleitrophica]